MDPRVSEIFTLTLEVPAADRQAFITEACGQDEALAQRVRQMLADFRKADDFFGGPPAGLRCGHIDENPEE